MSSGNAANFDAQRNRQFATTHWSVVKAVKNSDVAKASSALQKLCQTYWYPLYTYVRRQGMNADEAADLTQAFFADLLGREDLKKVDPEFGKFRSFLLAALKNFLNNQWKKAKAQKRGGGTSPISLDFGAADDRYQIEPAHSITADSTFLKQWAKTLLDLVHQQLQAEFANRGKAHQFEKLARFLAGKDSEETLASAAAQLNMTEVAVKVAVHRMRQRFGQLLRSEIENTVSTAEEVDAEIQLLFDVFRN